MKTATKFQSTPATMKYNWNPGFNIVERNLYPVSILSDKKNLHFFKKLMYLTDLRYCDIDAMKEIVDMARPFDATLYIVHVPAGGLPDIENIFAKDIFNQELLPRLQYSKLELIHLKKENMKTGLDGALNIINPDILAISNKLHSLYGHLFSKQTNSDT